MTGREFSNVSERRGMNREETSKKIDCDNSYRRERESSSKRRHRKSSRSREDKSQELKYKKRSVSKNQKSVSRDRKSNLRDRSTSKNHINSRSNKRKDLKSTNPRESKSRKDYMPRYRERNPRSKDKKSKKEDSFSKERIDRKRKSSKNSSRSRRRSNRRDSGSVKREKPRKKGSSRSNSRKSKEHKRHRSKSRNRSNRSKDRTNSHRRKHSKSRDKHDSNKGHHARSYEEDRFSKYPDEGSSQSTHNGGHHASWKDSVNRQELVKYPIRYPSEAHDAPVFGVDVLPGKIPRPSQSAGEVHRRDGKSWEDFINSNNLKTFSSFHVNNTPVAIQSNSAASVLDQANSIPSYITPQNKLCLPNRPNTIPSITAPIKLPNLNQPPPAFISPTDKPLFSHQPLPMHPSYPQNSFNNQVHLRLLTSDLQLSHQSQMNGIVEHPQAPQQAGFFSPSTDHLKVPFLAHPLAPHQQATPNFFIPPQAFQPPSHPPSMRFSTQPQISQMTSNLKVFPHHSSSINDYNHIQSDAIDSNNHNDNPHNNHLAPPSSLSSPHTSPSPPPPPAPISLSSELCNGDKDLPPPPPPPPRNKPCHISSTFTSNNNLHLSNKKIITTTTNNINNNNFTIPPKGAADDDDRYSPYSSTSEGSGNDCIANHVFEDSAVAVSPATEGKNNGKTHLDFINNNNNQVVMLDNVANKLIKKNINNNNHKSSTPSSEKPFINSHDSPLTTTPKNIKSDHILSLAKNLDLSGSLGIRVNDLKKVLETANISYKTPTTTTTTNDLTMTTTTSSHSKVDSSSNAKTGKARKIEQVVEEVKVALRPHFSKNLISKEDYKSIMRKAVPKIMSSKSDLDSARVKAFIGEYVHKVLLSKKMHKLKTLDGERMSNS